MSTSASSSGSARPGTFERRASKTISQAGLWNLVQDMAGAVDAMQEEIAQLRAEMRGGIAQILDLLKHGEED